MGGFRDLAVRQTGSDRGKEQDHGRPHQHQVPSVLAFGAQLAAVATPAANDGDDGDVSRKEGGDLPVLGPQRRVFGQRLYQGFGQNHQTGASDADPSEADPGAQESELKRRLRLAMAQQEPHDKNR